jgi:hypothetical protein
VNLLEEIPVTEEEYLAESSSDSANFPTFAEFLDRFRKNKTEDNNSEK